LALSSLVTAAAACGGTDDRGSSAAAQTTEPAASTELLPASTEPAGSTAPSVVTDTGTVDETDSSAPRRASDGILTIGTLMPRTGAGNEIGLAVIDAVSVGVAGINDGDGVLGNPVELVHADEGVNVADARSGIASLLENDVDAIIGPASSLVALELLDDLMAAGVLVCSPTATALALNDYPNRDLFFRSVPSDSLTATAMAHVALNTGVDSYTVLYLDDQFGRPFAQQAIATLGNPQPGDDLDGNLSAAVERNERPFSSDATDEELAEIARSLAEQAPRAVLVIADAINGWRMVQALAEAFPTDPPFIFVNDAMREPPSREAVAALPPAFREQITGVSPGYSPSPGEPTGPYATNALDCLNLIALAAFEADTDDPAEVAAEMIDVSIGGALCSSFDVCRNIAEQDRTINYQAANSIDLTPRGDPQRGRIGTFYFDASGLDVPQYAMTITETAD
jgi:branched-chain amino acid transport system substrate-binding protein